MKDEDFSGMTKEKIYIGDILHKARIKVGEQGPEASAVYLLKRWTTHQGGQISLSSMSTIRSFTPSRKSVP